MKILFRGLFYWLLTTNKYIIWAICLFTYASQTFTMWMVFSFFMACNDQSKKYTQNRVKNQDNEYLIIDEKWKMKNGVKINFLKFNYFVLFPEIYRATAGRSNSLYFHCHRIINVCAWIFRLLWCFERKSVSFVIGKCQNVLYSNLLKNELLNLTLSPIRLQFYGPWHFCHIVTVHKL